MVEDSIKTGLASDFVQSNELWTKKITHMLKEIDEWSHSALRKNGIDNYSVERIANKLKSERTPANYSDDARKLFILHERVCPK
ncbi:hypothetical protein CRU79_08555 [Escherichia sp. E4385]|nr:hypothetical protein CRU79_08555 [Escherichia sp. E4385]